MEDFHPRWPPLNVITPFHVEAAGLHLRGSGATIGSCLSGAPGANLIVYCGFKLVERAAAVKLSYCVGGTANGNVDMGIYDALKNRIVSSGSIAQGSANLLQELDITDTILPPGLYFLAIQLSSGTGTYLRVAAADENTLSNLPVYDEALGSFGLPTTAAFALSTSATPNIPQMGVHFDTLI